MKEISLAVVFCTMLLAGKCYGQETDDGDYEYAKLPPIGQDVDLHGHLVPSLKENTTDKPLIGRPDGHEPGTKETTRPQNTEKLLLGRPDGHEPSDLLGGPDGHETKDKDLIGKPDGHDSRVTDEDQDEDDPEERDKDLIGRPDGHDSRVNNDDNDENEYTYGDAYENEEEYEEEPLIRCKRPLCMMFCNFGFQTDANGCPVCKCLEDPCQGIRCTDGNICHTVECDSAHPCVKLSARCIPPSRSCPEPMCANYCPNGYAHNEEGCMTCTCKTDDSQPQEVQDDHSACPEVMCANFCPGGYEKNEQGCTTCKCITIEDTSCGDVFCDVGQICRTVDSKSYCAPKPMCHIAQDMAYMKRESPEVIANITSMFVPECDENGSYKPMQCHQLVSECWCVDDRGKEIYGTRMAVTGDEENQLQCEPNVTTAVHIHMMLMYNEGIYDDSDNAENENDEENVAEDDDNDFILNLDKSHEVFQNAISSWLLIDQHLVSITELEQKSKTSISVQLHIKGDGDVDLPSAVEHMKRRMRMGYCIIPLENSPADEDVYFTPDVDTLNVEHQYSTDVVTGSSTSDDLLQGRKWYRYCFGNYHILLVVATMLLLFVILALFSVLMVHRHRRNHRSVQFRHHKLENQLSHEQTKHLKGEIALDAHHESTVILVSADELEKKLAIA